MYRSSKPLRRGQQVRLHAKASSQTFAVTVVEAAAGEALLDFGSLDASEFDRLLLELGEVPLPPYIERARARAAQPPDVEADRQRYQTVFAAHSGSVAAPTAGLHFTPELLAALTAAGHPQVTITLHIGPGTFMPLRSDSIADHVMHSERYHIPAASAAAIAAARAAGRKILAVGTTVVRTLESATDKDATAPRPGWGESKLFIVPPYRFAAVDALLTNFHLPRSTLMMLCAALAGRQRLLDAYQAAIAAGYRFYSFGDAMLIPRPLAEPAAADSPRPRP
jgi:S-adenosylmethionine:tRNA ribosyltransferase-isomerase